MGINKRAIKARDEVRNRLLNDDEFVLRALQFLYARQTSAEQIMEDAVELNGRGFNSRDANFLSSLAKQASLSGNQRVWARRVLPKYWRQLQEIL